MLVTTSTCGISSNLVPVTLHSGFGGKGVLQAQMAKANSHLADLRADAEALATTKQPDGKVVPTWNNAMVQARGRPIVIDDSDWL